MRLLALETSGFSGGAAVWETTSGVPYEVPCAAGQRSAQGLAVAIRSALQHVDWKGTDVEAVAVTAGPGSFTGLRIGVTTAKTFAYAARTDLIAVDTLDVLARQATLNGAVLHTVLDAHRNELFAASFARSASGDWDRMATTHLASIADWLAALRPGDVVTGPVVDKLLPRLPSGVVAVTVEQREPRAATVALLAAELHAAGRRDSLWELVPWYGRLAAAEEKRLAQQSPTS
jgi:tRNA threonylcarbamoyladenosine biosynthesis protein TsaB